MELETTQLGGKWASWPQLHLCLYLGYLCCPTSINLCYQRGLPLSLPLSSCDRHVVQVQSVQPPPPTTAAYNQSKKKHRTLNNWFFCQLKVDKSQKKNTLSLSTFPPPGLPLPVLNNLCLTLYPCHCWHQVSLKCVKCHTFYFNLSVPMVGGGVSSDREGSNVVVMVDGWIVEFIQRRIIWSGDNNCIHIQTGSRLFADGVFLQP